MCIDEIPRIFPKSQSLYREGEFGIQSQGVYRGGEFEIFLKSRGLGRSSEFFQVPDPIIYRRKDRNFSSPRAYIEGESSEFF